MILFFEICLQERVIWNTYDPSFIPAHFIHGATQFALLNCIYICNLEVKV